MPQYPTCSHIKDDGVLCGAAALRHRRYCYAHLAERGRRLRRAQALRDNLPFRLEIQSLDSPYAVRSAITEIVRALGTGQLDHRVAGKMLYGIQLARAENQRIAGMEAAADQDEAAAGDATRVQEWPDFEKEFGIAPGADIDAETEALLQKADEQAELRQPAPMPPPPPGLRVGSAAYRVYREEAYQVLKMQLQQTQHQLRDYYDQKRRDFEAANPEYVAAMKKRPVAAVPAKTEPGAAETA